ncbi:hypothetical protein AXF42_Ash018294 [Apostasia shenzhenica]|uniref:Uncharacterized protein n=1 Tax=Apostasia shenzhenica TaxID=1088818 RepID=A0A2I0B2Q1_9ASPA|nr:hypothetical protein AXF42_Ash018294 [Apostasia shenzhenica]
MECIVLSWFSGGKEVDKLWVLAACRPPEGPEAAKEGCYLLILVLPLGIREGWSMRILSLWVWEKCFVRETVRSGQADCDRHLFVTSRTMLLGMVLAHRGRGLVEPSCSRFDRGLTCENR